VRRDDHPRVFRGEGANDPLRVIGLWGPQEVDVEEGGWICDDTARRVAVPAPVSDRGEREVVALLAARFHFSPSSISLPALRNSLSTIGRSQSLISFDNAEPRFAATYRVIVTRSVSIRTGVPSWHC
jgi:hypothetical protein